MAVYVNGHLRGLDMNLTKASDMGLCWVGTSGNGGTKDDGDTFSGFPGAIDTVRISRRELSAEEVRRQADEI